MYFRKLLTGEKPFVCPDCDKKFIKIIKRGDLNKHRSNRVNFKR